MARGPSPFRQCDVTRAVRAAQAAGMVVARVVVDPLTGKITVEAGSPSGQDSVARDAATVATERIAAMRRGDL